MSQVKHIPVVILIADDDEDDQKIIQQAFKESRLVTDVHFVNDGDELLDFLYKRNTYKGNGIPRPDIIILDLNMPGKDGRDALREIKIDPDLRSIPTVILTTSKADEDIARSYELGANSYITKPVGFENMIQVINDLGHYWFQIVKLPGK